MSQADVSYCCGACGYPLNLSSSNHITSKYNNNRSLNKDFISFASVDLSRFTQLDEVNCFPISLGGSGMKTKLLCRKCGVHIGYGYGQASIWCGFDSSDSPNSVYKKFKMKTQALQPSEES